MGIYMITFASKYKIFIFTSLSFVTVITLVNLYLYAFTDLNNRKPDQRFLNPNYNRLIINTTGCEIPNPILNPSLLKHFHDVEPFSCKNNAPLIESNLTSIYLEESALKTNKINNKNDIFCCYTPFQRMPGNQENSDTNALYDKDCITFEDSARIFQQFIVVKCFDKKNKEKSESLIYTDYFSFVPPPENFFENLKIVEEEKLNILIIGIDSVSRLNFHRQFPATANLLGKMQAIEMLGYNKIGKNSYPILFPMLTGHNYSEVESYCPGPETNPIFYDNCTYLWDKYKESGYVTAFAEDQPVFGLFYYLAGGFLKQPTDYYWHTYSLESYKNINSKEICFGSRPAYRVLLKYIKKFIATMKMKYLPYFGFFWQSTLTHDDINWGQIGDNDYAKLLAYIKEEGILSNTVLIVMSDHGLRVGEMRWTFQGLLEDRLPFMFIKLPDWLKKRFSYLETNLKINANRLVTVYDLHETLMQLVDVSKLPDESLENIGIKRGYSLFAPITENRTCETAQIIPQFCTCQKSEPVSTGDEVVLEVAYFILFHLNYVLNKFPQCVPLALKRIVSARKSIHDNSLYDPYLLTYTDYTIVLKASPSNAMLEATVRKQLTGKFTLSLSGSVDRINRYHEQSRCVKDKIAKMYCYCSNLKFQKKNYHL